MTWSYNRNEDLFWPQTWLPTESDISTARIFTYGYNAYYASQGPNSIAGIADFSKQLLFDMKFGNDGFVEELKIGRRPIIFVVHSMGGLVFKKAIIQGYSDEVYSDLISEVKAVLFLSTPHRGTNLADIMNRILSVSIFNHAPKQYLSELKQNSPFIEDINDQFRKYAPRLQIFSFYETLETAIGPKNLMVLQRTSSTLGYPQEVIEPLNADHHYVCKFPSREDPSYKSIKGVIKSLVSTYRRARRLLQDDQMTLDNRKLLALLGTFPDPKDDCTSLLHLWRQGTCEDALYNDEVQEWRGAVSGSKVLWIHAQPGSGKSVISAVNIQYMKERGYACAYYFFRYGDSGKRSAGSFLQSVIYQIAQELPSFRRALSMMKDNGVSVEKIAPRMIWDKIFIGILFKIEPVNPIYVIVDGLDESDSANTVIGFFGSIEASRVPLRFLVTSRNTPDISTAFNRISTSSLVTKLSLADNSNDIRLYAESEMECMRGDLEFRRGVVEEIIRRAEGNFLWVTLAIKEILQCHSPEDVTEVLQEMPVGMQSMYSRMEASIARITRPSDLAIVKTVLSWATYCRKPLKVNELVQALPRDMPAIIDLRHTIAQLCGHFVVVDSNDCVILVHKTAKEYLLKTAKLPFEFHSQHIHEHLFHQSLAVLLETRVRGKLSQKEKLSEGDIPAFVIYATTSWAHHLSRSTPTSDGSLTLLVRFLKSSSILLWIRVLASLQQLKGLIAASSALRTFSAARRKFDSVRQPSQHRLTDLEVVEQWATDLLKIVGKFSDHLHDDPAAIQRLVPQLCPRRSAIYRQFSRQPQLSVKNISNSDWDDCLGRVWMGSGQKALQIVCSNRHLAVSTTGWKIFLWDCATFEKTRSLNHDEYIAAISFNSTGEFLASYGHLATKIWDVSTGKVMHSICNIRDSLALKVVFADDDKQLIAGLNTGQVAQISYRETSQWNLINSGFLQDDDAGAYRNTPTTIAFSTASTFVAVGYRGSPLEVWDMIEKTRVNKCKRRPEYEAGEIGDWKGVMELAWHPNGEMVLGIYNDGTVFKWNPFETFDYQELEADSRSYSTKIQCSPDGTLFLLSDVDGSVRIYSYDHFSLVYKLASEDRITGICFSMDGRRFYDLRGSYCNIWEPNALFRLPDADECGSEYDTEAASVVISNHASEAFADMPIRITALAARPIGGMFCYGNEDGLVEVNGVSVLTAQLAGKTKREETVEFIVWSKDGSYLAYSEADTITVMKVVVDHGSTIRSSETLLSIDLDLEGGMIHQILLHPNAEFVLVADAESVVIYDVETGTSCATLKLGHGHKWANHPSTPDQILMFDTESIVSYTWQSLEVAGKWDINRADPPESDRVEGSDRAPHSPSHKKSFGSHLETRFRDYVDDIFVSANGSYAVVSISQDGPYQKSWTDIQIINLLNIGSPKLENLASVSIPRGISQAIERPLGVIDKNNLVFIDRRLWVCSWRITTEEDMMRRHFFLPRDWVSAEILGLCVVTDDGTLLVPRKGEVAVIRSSLCSKGR